MASTACSRRSWSTPTATASSSRRLRWPSTSRPASRLPLGSSERTLEVVRGSRARGTNSAWLTSSATSACRRNHPLGELDKPFCGLTARRALVTDSVGGRTHLNLQRKKLTELSRCDSSVFRHGIQVARHVGVVALRHRTSKCRREHRSRRCPRERRYQSPPCDSQARRSPARREGTPGLQEVEPPRLLPSPTRAFACAWHLRPPTPMPTAACR